MFTLTRYRTGATLGRFLADTRGNLTIVVAGSMVAVMMMIGSAVDYGRAQLVKSTMMSALDSAALAGANELVRNAGSRADVEKVVRAVFESNIVSLTEDGIATGSLEVRQDRKAGEVEVVVALSMPTTFTQIAGIRTIDVGAASAARVSDKDVELTMMLDVTGSMRGRKIADLRAAAKDLIGILMPKSPSMAANKVRIGLVPYSQGVNAGAYASLATDGVSKKCATERTGAEADSDVGPAVAPLGNGSSKCPPAKILPLTDNRNKLIKGVNGLSATGRTAGHTGIGWSWYTLSPSWQSIWPMASRPALYTDDKTMKVAVLMTDGEFNTAYDYKATKGRYVENKNKTKSKTRALALCKQMNRKGVRVYTVAFALKHKSAKEIMKICASDAGKFYDAADGAELRRAFRSIAAEVSRLRISK